MLISKDEFVHWMHDPVTEFMRTHILQLALTEKLKLAGVCGVNSSDDMYHKGLIKGIEEGWNLDDILQETFKDADSEGLEAASQAY